MSCSNNYLVIVLHKINTNTEQGPCPELLFLSGWIQILSPWGCENTIKWDGVWNTLSTLYGRTAQKWIMLSELFEKFPQMFRFLCPVWNTWSRLVSYEPSCQVPTYYCTGFGVTARRGSEGLNLWLKVSKFVSVLCLVEPGTPLQSHAASVERAARHVSTSDVFLEAEGKWWQRRKWEDTDTRWEGCKCACRDLFVIS